VPFGEDECDFGLELLSVEDFTTWTRAELSNTPGELTATLSAEDRYALDALRAGDEAGFAHFMQLHGAALMRAALFYVKNQAVAEEVVQETWLGVLESLERFEGRASLKTWLFRILRNVAHKRAGQERRSVPFSAMEASESSSGAGGPDASEVEPAVSPDRFIGDGERWAGHWLSAPRRWSELPDAALLWAEMLEIAHQSILALPEMQRMVVGLRDVEGWCADEVCELLGVSEANQRVLLHRARSKLRRALEAHFEDA
jgi:RNA polymerase sigma-70 factor (ECF subfamily)